METIGAIIRWLFYVIIGVVAVVLSLFLLWVIFIKIIIPGFYWLKYETEKAWVERPTIQRPYYPAPTPTPVVYTTPTPATQPTATAPAGQPAGNKWFQDVEVAATDQNGVVVNLPHTGLYQVTVLPGSSYNTGTVQRTVVAVLDGAPPVTGCGQYNEPCLRQGKDFWIGDWNGTTTGQNQNHQFQSTQVRIVTIDDINSYTNLNSGSVKIRISDVTP